jgi:hypothetical protein
MDLSLLGANLLSAPILFFALGVIAGLVKSDLAIPEAVTKLLSLYLLWAIGLKGGVQLAASPFSVENALALGLGMSMACAVPFVVFAMLRRSLGIDNAAALAGVYGSVSAVTFLAATDFLKRIDEPFGGHMVAALALMESPAIIIALLLRSHAAQRITRESRPVNSKPAAHTLAESLREAALNGPMVLLTGSMAIGAAIGPKGFDAIAPLATGLFPGVLAFFLLELGLVAARKSRMLRVVGWRLVVFALALPVASALVTLALARVLQLDRGDTLLLVLLCGSASYIAAPAVMRTAVPRASPGVYVPLALAVTFPFNVTIGIPTYWALIERFWV